MCGAAQKSITGADDQLTVLGTLTCSLMGQGEGSTAGVGRDVRCQFQPGQQGAEESYVGTIQGVGQAKLLFGRGAVILAVKAPASTEMAPGLLAQSYAADAGSSGGAPAPLVGERNKLIVLQPLAEEEGRVTEGKTQPDAILITIELRLASTPA